MKISRILVFCGVSFLCVSCSFFEPKPPEWYEEDFSEEQTLNIEQRELYTATIEQPISAVLETWSADLMSKGSNFTKSFTAQSANGNTVGKSTWRFVSNFLVHWKFTDSNSNVVYDDPLGISNKKTELYLNLEDGMTYQIKTTHGGTNGTYEFSVYAPNGIHVIPSNAASKHVKIDDVYRYKKQVLTYEYTPNISGKFRFEITINSNWLIKDQHNNVTYQPSYSGKPETSISVSLVADMHYTIFITQDSTTIGPVVFTMYRPSETVEIGSFDNNRKLKINDYLYYPTETKSFQFTALFERIEIYSIKWVDDWYLYDSYGNNHLIKGNYYYYGSGNDWHYHITCSNLASGAQYRLVMPFDSSTSGTATIYLRAI